MLLTKVINLGALCLIHKLGIETLMKMCNYRGKLEKKMLLIGYLLYTHVNNLYVYMNIICNHIVSKLHSSYMKYIILN